MKVATMLRLACPFVKTNRNAAIVEQPEATSGIRDGSQAKPPAGNITGRSTTITWLMLSMLTASMVLLLMLTTLYRMMLWLNYSSAWLYDKLSHNNKSIPTLVLHVTTANVTFQCILCYNFEQ